MKTIFKFLIVFILIIIFIYVCNISFMPDSIILIQGEKLDLNTLFGLSIKQIENNGTIQASSLLNKEKVSEVGKADFNLSLFNTIQLKEITVNVIPKTKVVPIGKSIGMKLYTDGVLVVGMSEIEGKKPYQNSGIEEGDRIVEVNNNQIDTTDELINTVNRSNGQEVEIKYIETDNNKSYLSDIIAAFTKRNIHIDSFKAKEYSKNCLYEITIKVKNKEEVERIILDLEMLPFISKVSRSR